VHDLDAQVKQALTDGYEIVQQGRVLIPFRPVTKKPSFSERVEGCNALLIVSGDLLLDDDERWVHLRRV
jgi:hypothetical protein